LLTQTAAICITENYGEIRIYLPVPVAALSKA